MATLAHARSPFLYCPETISHVPPTWFMPKWAASHEGLWNNFKIFKKNAIKFLKFLKILIGNF